jgi:hypothetical protein
MFAVLEREISDENAIPGPMPSKVVVMIFHFPGESMLDFFLCEGKNFVSF